MAGIQPARGPRHSRGAVIPVHPSRYRYRAPAIAVLAVAAATALLVIGRDDPPDPASRPTPSLPPAPLPVSPPSAAPAPAASPFRQPPPRLASRPAADLPPDVLPGGFRPEPGDVPAADLDQLPRVTYRPVASRPGDAPPGPAEVRVLLRVDRSGAVARALPLDGQDPLLAAAAAEAALSWRFEPATRAGEPVAFLLFATVDLR